MTTAEAFIELFFVSRSPIGRALPDVKNTSDGRACVGPWRDTRRVDGEIKTDLREIYPEMIDQHLTGELRQKGDRAQLMTYAVNGQGMAAFAAIDLDAKEGGHADKEGHFETFQDAHRAAVVLNRVAEGMGLRLWIETTRGGSSRAWVFFEAVSAADAKDLGRLMLLRANLHKSIEVFPKQTVASLTGNGVFLPYWGGAKPGRQVMTDTQTGNILTAEEFAEAALQNRADASLVSATVKAARDAKEITATAPPSKRQASGDSEPGSVAFLMWGVQVSKCAYLKKLVETAEQGGSLSYDDWLRLCSHLRPFGEEGRKEFHRLSEFDTGRYNSSRADALFDSLTGGPSKCETNDCGKHPQDDCGLPPGMVSSTHWAFQGIRLRMASEEKRKEEPEAIPVPLPQDEEEPFDFRQTTPDFPFAITGQGIWMTRKVGREVETSVILPHALHIAARTHDLDTDIESVTLAWLRDNQWKKRTVPQRVVASQREIVALADYSLLVNAVNARDLVQYIAHLQSRHKDTIPLTRAVSTCGWKDAGGEPVFMWGETPICAGKDAPAITYIPETQETQGLTSAFRSLGDIQSWVEMARSLDKFPIPAFGVAASFLSPFLTDLGISQNPILDFAGASSSGKTTVLKLAASVWGFAPENDGGLVRSWNSTPVYLERMANAMNGVPIFLDESHVANPDLVGKALYQLANGTGKGRGAMSGGTQRTATFRSVVFSAGEMKLTASSEHQGATARVVGFWGSPFGPNKGREVAELTQGSLSHFGHAGPKVLQTYLLKRDAISAQLQADKKKSQERLAGRAKDVIGERLLPIFAAIEAVGNFANLVLGLGWDMEKITDAAFTKATESRSVSPSQKALEEVVSWADGNPARFIGAAYDAERPQELAGVIRSDGAICFLGDYLRRLFLDRKYPYDSTLANWADAGWLEVNANDPTRHTKVMKIEGKSTRAVILKPTTVGLARGMDIMAESEIVTNW